MRNCIAGFLFCCFSLALCCAPTSAEEPPTFRAYDLIIDSRTERLAAYQVEFTYPAGMVKIVGLEGGEGVYASAPYYDRKGFEGGHIIIAAFTTKHDQAPTGATRVARIHLAVSAGVEPELAVRLVTAAKPGGTILNPSVKLKAAGKDN
jgi:hypothetical protein